ncbi:MAG TPA: hypothetical protein VL424_08750 [Pararobbsia sp.]|nr:hypothetical protein [Pararobbsia sp.]
MIHAVAVFNQRIEMMGVLSSAAFAQTEQLRDDAPIKKEKIIDEFVNYFLLHLNAAVAYRNNDY